MKRNLTNENFEDFLKQSADGLRMKAPDRVWQNLSRELGKKRRRFLTGLSAFLLMATVAGYYIISDSGSSVQRVSAAGDKQPTLVNSIPGNNTGATPVASSTEAKVVTMQPRVQPSSHSRSAVGKREKATATVIPFNNDGQRAETETNLTGGEALPGEAGFTPTVVDAYPEQETATRTEAGTVLQKAAEALPLSIESIVNGYKAKGAAKRFQTQLYFTPTISYRKLTENKSYLRSLNPAAIPAGYPALNSRVSNNVTHKPDVGFELGFAAKYALSNRLKIRSGLQFNVNRYDVKAFSSLGSVATIALNNGSRIDSLNTFSRYSNINGNGYNSDWLQNLYFQVSLPVGVEYLFAGDERLHFGIAATVQPTYVLGDRAYLITTDYKSYTEVPWLTRRWNVNTSLETFVTYKRWQFGPQVRYQLLSSFVSQYPVKENLFDFGLKVGVRLNK